MTRVRHHLTYANVISTLCLFLLLGGGTAYALDGSNTVFSDDIVNGEVKNGDLAVDSVASGKIQDRQVKNADLSIGASSSNTIADGGIQGVDVHNDALTGTQIDDGSLGIAEFSSSIPTVQVTRTSALSTDDGEVTDLTWDAESYDTAIMHDNSTNPGRLTAPVDGIYAVTVQVDWDFNVAGRRTLALFAVDPDPGSTALAAIEDRPPTNDGFANPTLTTQVQLAAGDYVEANVEQTSGGSLDVNAPTGQTKFSMTWLAPGP